MAFNINDLTQYFDNPALSKFDRKTKKGFTIQLGKMAPVNWEFLNFGNSAKGTSYHSLRLAPMLAPNYSDLQVQEHSVFVPCRVIMDNFESTFNYAENKDGAILPSLSASEYHQILLCLTKGGYSPIGSLLDFLGYPVYADLFDSLSTLKARNGGTVFNPFSTQRAKVYFDLWNTPSSYFFSFTYRETDYTLTFANYPSYLAIDIVSFAITKLYPHLMGDPVSRTQAAYDFFLRIPRYNETSDKDNFIPTFAEVIEASSYETSVSLVNAFQSYLYSLFLGHYLENETIPAAAPRYTTLPLRAYWRFHIDWNTNGNFVDRDLMLSEYVYNLDYNLVEWAQNDMPDYIWRKLSVADRLWRNDFYTSLLPTSAVDNAIEIPANSTVLDLAKLTAFQKLVLKLSYSSRYRDVVWNVFKVKPSDARLQQSSVISRRYHSVGIGETLQTSQSTESSVLGSFSGRGYSSGQNDVYHIYAEEPGILINMFSIISFASYADALHPNIHMDDIFDIPIPDMDVLGNQPIYSDLLSGNVIDSDKIFGFGRQYQEFLINYDTVHGSFKTTLPYWQLTRRFGSTPYLNDEFLRMSSQNDFDSIFSVPDSDHAMVTVVYKNSVTRHVHRNVRILI